MKARELQKFLESNGFTFCRRGRGSHVIYKNDKGQIIPFPCVKGGDVHSGLAKHIVQNVKKMVS